ncbi:Superfamily II DNA helicase [Pseudomonas chlororaphis subsp. aurantiaca]|uniref:PAAR domain-containing protein n=1 Tax=Pseudomonas chlororaphis TaxID=587753 RepID=UPI000F57DA31|nr:PAAR domain-containing protein [Pseudomonas chlororaphis]AZC95170.1 Superfamily II DNA helicase [Pseudomonas chlororaphis subsp. piscium]AZD21740.1 Superfamily II DNA helicase [Pseudomonas chlororaphis subsp. aurantiaca]
MAKPAARQTDPTSCPIPGHGTNPIATGSPNVFFDGLPAARQDDTCTCGSTLSTGLASTVFINGKNAATLDTGGTHGNIVIGGSGTIIIGDLHTPAPFTSPTPMTIPGNWIGFKIPATESYEGLSCVAHFEDGSVMQGVFDAKNTVKFSNPTGKACTAIDYGTEDASESVSILDSILSKIQR